MGLGTPPRFKQAVSWSAQIADYNLARRFPELQDIMDPRLDPRLLNIWADVRELTRMANSAATTKAFVTESQFHYISTSLPYRLLHLEFESGSPSEVLRLCLLAYTKSLLIQTKGLGKNMTHLSTQLTCSIRAWVPRARGSPVLLWVLFMSSISIFEDMPTDPDWLRSSLVQEIAWHRQRSWSETLSVLSNFLWVHAIHDRPGEALFTELSVIAAHQARVQTVPLNLALM